MTKKSHRTHPLPSDFAPRRYTVRPGWKLFLCAAGVIEVIGGAAFAFFQSQSTADTAVRIVIILTGVGFVLLGGYGLFWCLRAQVSLTPDEIQVRGAFTSRGLRKKDIRGWRSIRQSDGPSTICLVPGVAGTRILKLSRMIGFDQFFQQWLHGMTNLDEKDARISEEEFLRDSALGATKQERRDSMQRGRKTARILAWAAVAVCVWGLVYPRPYPFIMTVLAGLPPLALMMAWHSRGLYRLDHRWTDSRPALAIPFVLPGAVLAWRALNDFNLTGWSIAGTISTGIALVLSVAALRADSSLRKLSLFLAMLFCMSVYGFGVALECNGLLERSAAKPYTVTVVRKSIVHSRSRTSYRLDLAPWGPDSRKSSPSVSEQLYDHLQPGDSVCIRLHDGALGIPWYTVSLCR